MLVGEFVRVGDLDLYTRVSRLDAREDGRPPLVMVHGLSVAGEYMVPLAEALEDSFAVRIPDLPGFGRSDKPDHTLDIVELAEALAGWVDAARVGAPALLANSLGCQVLAEFAARHPEKAGPLVFVGPTMDPAMGLSDLVVNLVRDAGREEPRLIGVHLVDDVRAGVRRSWQTLEAARRHDMVAALGGVRSPLLVVRGGRDPLVSAEWGRQVAELGGGEFVELADAPHAANFSAPDALAVVVRDFLRRQSSPAPAPHATPERSR